MPLCTLISSTEVDEQCNECDLFWLKNHVGWSRGVASSWEAVMEKERGSRIFERLLGDFDL